MKVLVTGHLGYIGTRMTPRLVAAGYEVLGLDSDLFEACTFGALPPPIPTIRKDIRDVEPADVRGVDAIVHLAALSNDPLGNLNPDLTYAINHRATIRLAEIAREAGVRRFLFSSSCSMYGKAGDAFLDETATFNPVTPYAESKVLVERDLSAMADARFSPVFLRNATAYGVSPRMRFDLVLNNLAAWAFTTGTILLKSDGTPWRPLVHIDDITEAFLCALRAPIETVHNLAVNVGSTTENYQMRDLAAMTRAVIPNCTVQIAEGAGPDPRCYRVNFEKIRRVFPEFAPRWTARQGIEECYAAYRRLGLKRDEFEGERYMRITHIKRLLADGRLDRNLRRT